MKNKFTEEKIEKKEKEILNYFLGLFRKTGNVYRGENGRELLGINVCGCIHDGYYSNSKNFNKIYDLISYGYLEHLRDYLKNYNMTLSLYYWSDEMSDIDYVDIEILWDYYGYYKEKPSRRILTKEDNK